MSESYNEVVIDHFSNPRNVGEIPDADAVGKVGSPTCGDVMWVFVKIGDGVISDVSFKTFGCGAAIASGSMLTEMARGKTIADARKLTDQNVADALGGLPPQKFHCSNLAATALQRALDQYEGVFGGQSAASEGCPAEGDCPGPGKCQEAR